MLPAPDITPPVPPISPVEGVNPELAVLLSRVPVRRVPAIVHGGRIDHRGLYDPNFGILLRSDERDPGVARHEYLNAAQHRYQPFSSDVYAGLPSFNLALRNSFPNIPNAYALDPYHSFVWAAEAYLRDPNLLPEPMRHYFRSLTHIPRPEVNRGPR